MNIWVIALDPHLYVHAGTNRSTWVENIEADPNVRLRVNDSIYELEATRVDAQEEFDRFSDAYEKKYGTRPRNESVREASSSGSERALAESRAGSLIRRLRTPAMLWARPERERSRPS